MTTHSNSLPPRKTEGRQPSKKIRKAVRNAFDPEVLADICVLQDFSDYGTRHDLPDGKDGRKRFYYYQDNGSDILAVAHLDSVQADGECQVIDTAAGLLAVSGALDDRLGVYVILEMLPQLGITCDWLLSTDEEICAPTSEDFYPDKDYNWMFSFDRGGTDVVMYEYETPELCHLVEEAGAQVGRGTFSDICVMEHLECAGFNWGVGYEEYHSRRSHAWLEDTFRMVARFVKFYEANAATYLKHYPYWGTSKGSSKSTAWDWDDVTWDGEKWEKTNYMIVQADCGHYVDADDPDTYVEGYGQVVCSKCGAV